jgi:molybdopterin synthase catalytic subunit
MLIRITRNPIDPVPLIEAVRDPRAGAIALFLGTTRNHHEGREVTRLDYEAYSGMAEKELEGIGQTIRERWEVSKIAIAHRVGRVEIGESSVGIAISSPHRKEAFAACQYAIDTLKKTVPIWKKEFYKGGEIWVGSQDGLTEFQDPSPSAVGDIMEQREQHK